MTLSRRGFITGLIAAPIAAPAVLRVIEPMTLFVPKPKVLPPGNYLLTTNQIIREAVRLFNHSNKFLASYDCEYDVALESGEKVGHTLRIRLPNDFTMRTI